MLKLLLFLLLLVAQTALFAQQTAVGTDSLSQARQSAVRQKGVYGHAALRFNFVVDQGTPGVTVSPNVITRRTLLLPGFSAELGYSLSKSWDLGAGFGIDWMERYTLMPLFVTGRYFLPQKAKNLFLHVSAGTTVPLVNDSFLRAALSNTSSRGELGLYFHPALGGQIVISENLCYVIDLGWNLHQARVVTNTLSAPSTVEDIRLAHFILRMGFLF